MKEQTQQSLQVIKAALDQAISNGTFKNLEQIHQVLIAFTHINTILNKNEVGDNN